MIVDSSALLALIGKEPESTIWFRALLLSPINRISAGTMLEASLVVDGLRNPRAVREAVMGIVGVMRRPLSA